MVTFSKEDDIYKITRITGNQDNLLGISFADKPSGANPIEIVEWFFPNIDNSKIRTSKEEVLTQVLEGLKSINEALGTDYQLSKIYYVPADDGSGFIYQTLLKWLIKHYHSGKEFKESRHYHSGNEFQEEKSKT
jgi:hypothetical protein